MKSDSYLNVKTFKMSKLDFQNLFQPIVSRFMLDACKKHDMPHVLYRFQFKLVTPPFFISYLYVLVAPGSHHVEIVSARCLKINTDLIIDLTE